jgi:hypothetical protein
MSCNCKNGTPINQMENGEENKPKNDVLKYVMNSIFFLISLIFLPFLVGFIIWFMFKTIVLNKSMDILPILNAVARNLQVKSNEDEDDVIDEEEFYSLTEDDVVLVDAEDITNK